MARSTGPILAAGAITVTNRVVFNEQPVDWRVISATGLTAIAFALLEKATPELAVGLSWIALATVLLTRVDPTVPSPAESFVKWYNK
jgi:hypothetical protein